MTREQTGSRGFVWLWLAAGAGSTVLALVVVLGVAVAVLGASFTGCQTGEADTSGISGPAPSAYALQSIPPER